MEMMVDGRDMNDRPAADPLVTKHRGDARLAKRVKDAIAQDANLSELAKQVKVYTNNGNVILKGMVASPEEKTKIESLTRETSSTALIENDLKIVRP
jgi:osmotically-inducible protein OsmY